jgi:Asp-tRNA(Asn)/Glu-tRNA(Gln) amidotransferase B subunit
MTHIEKIEQLIATARVEKNNLVKNLFQTLKGEYETASKKGEETGNVLVEKLAKKMIKNAETVGTADAQEEIKLLKLFLPAELTDDEVIAIINKTMEANPEKVAEFKLGNKGTIGWFMGHIVKQNPTINSKVLISFLTIILNSK